MQVHPSEGKGKSVSRGGGGTGGVVWSGEEKF